MYTEDDLLPLSALQHLLYCERRAALVHIEQLWHDNTFTLEGNHLHEKVDLPGQSAESRRDVRITRGMMFRSFRLGLTGKADVVEFHRADDGSSVLGVALPGVDNFWIPFPVEYKRGNLRKEDGYEIQLCAQALCLEEMLKCAIPAGAIFYGESRRRLDVVFDAPLRTVTETAAARLHDLIASGTTPRAKRERKCDKCSMLEICMPDALSKATSVEAYIQRETQPEGLKA
ncbi:MAG: CRISPR-associated protein Cas4 [Planctomycetota bacterium]